MIEANLAGFSVRHQSLHAQVGPVFGFTSPTPWGGFSVQEDFYNAFDANDKRRGMFLAGPMYTIEAGSSFSEEFGFFFSNPKDEFKLRIESMPDGLIILPSYDIQPNGSSSDDSGARYLKYELALGETNDISNDFAIFRFAEVLLMRAEGLWRQNSGDAEALMLVNQVRERAGLEGLATLTEDDLYWEYKKETALENHARSITIRFGHWEDAWFLKEANPDEEYKRWYAIPESQLGANPNLVQNPGYIGG